MTCHYTQIPPDRSAGDVANERGWDRAWFIVEARADGTERRLVFRDLDSAELLYEMHGFVRTTLGGAPWWYHPTAPATVSAYRNSGAGPVGDNPKWSERRQKLHRKLQIALNFRTIALLKGDAEAYKVARDEVDFAGRLLDAEGKRCVRAAEAIANALVGLAAMRRAA